MNISFPNFKIVINMRNTYKLILYTVPLFIFEIIMVILFSFWGRYAFYGKNLFQELIPLIPGGFMTDLIILFTAIPLLIIIIGFLICPLITILYYGVHRLYRLFSKEHEYKLIKMRENIVFKRLFYRLIFPAFFSISLAMMFNSTIDTSIFLAIPKLLLLQVYMASFIFAIPAFLLLAPLWILDDSGIITHLKEDLGYRRPPETESISRTFNNAYKGYVGISFVFSFILLIWTTTFFILRGDTDPRIEITLIITFVGFPFALSAMFAPFCILYEIWLKKLVSFMHKVARADKLPYVEEKFVSVNREG